MTNSGKGTARHGAAARSRSGKDETMVEAGELVSLLDHVRYAISRFQESGIVFAHGTTDPVAEAVFIVGEALHLAPDQFEMFATARVARHESQKILALISERVESRKPAAYLLNKIYMRGLPFYVDERVIVPRSFIGELLESHFDGGDASLIADPYAVTDVLELCTGSGCLAILAARAFPEARIDAVELSEDAFAVAQRNVADYALNDRITLYRGDLFGPLHKASNKAGNKANKAQRYDLIITNPPYVDAEGMAALPDECRHEPAMAFDGGDDGLDIVRRIIDGAGAYLNDDGGLLCEIGRGREVIEDAYPELPFLWLDTEDSEAEVFWLPADMLPVAKR